VITKSAIVVTTERASTPGVFQGIGMAIVAGDMDMGGAGRIGEVNGVVGIAWMDDTCHPCDHDCSRAP